MAREVTVNANGHMFSFSFETLEELEPIVNEMARSTDVLEFDFSAARQVMVEARKLVTA